MNQKSHSFRCLTGSSLKIIAILAMAIDHFAASILLYGFLQTQDGVFDLTGNLYIIYNLMRTIGRIAFPIFCFSLVEGFFHTSNRTRYAMRLFLFALLSEFPFDFALFQTPINWGYQNVFFTLLIGFLTIWGMERGKTTIYALPLQVISLLAGSALAYALHTDYDYKGILLIVILYLFRGDHKSQTIAGCISLLWEPAACLAFLPINMYNGKRGISLKYFFYAFYPLHLLLYGIILYFFF